MLWFLPLVMQGLQQSQASTEKAVSNLKTPIDTPANSFGEGVTPPEARQGAVATAPSASAAGGGGSGKQFGMNMLQSGISSLMQSSQNAMQGYGKNTVQLPQHKGFGTMSRQSRGF